MQHKTKGMQGFTKSISSFILRTTTKAVIEAPHVHDTDVVAYMCVNVHTLKCTLKGKPVLQKVYKDILDFG